MAMRSTILLLHVLHCASPALAAVDPATHKLCIQARDYAGCVKAMTSAPQPVEDPLAQLRNAMKQVAGRLSFGTSLADSTATFQPVVDQLAITESKEPNSLAVRSAQESVRLFDILQTAWRVRIESENRAFRGVSGNLRVYNCKSLKATADAFDSVSTSGKLYWSYSKGPLGLFGDTCKVNYGQEPDALMYPIIVRLLRDGAISPEEIRARDTADQERKAKAAREKELCAMGPWNRYLEENPSIKEWAKHNPAMADAKKKRYLADPKNQAECTPKSNWGINWGNTNLLNSFPR
jgi:hypothetical protein